MTGGLTKPLGIKAIIEKVAEQIEAATIRQLPGGEVHSGRLESCEGQRLRLSIPTARSAEFRVGALVEVQSEQLLYLGVVLGRRDSTMLVAIEHALDRTALAAIQEVWSPLPGE